MIEFYLYFALKREFNKIFGENKPGYEMSVYESFSLKFGCLDKVRMQLWIHPKLFFLNLLLFHEV
jgi:hypothetical protein